MELYFFRHGDAEDSGERALSDRGQIRVHHVTGALTEAGIHVDAVFTSPLLRARQTAQIAAGASDVEPQVTDRLDCRATFNGVAKLLEDVDANSAVMLVGHEPDLSAIVGKLIGGHVEMKKAAMACVTCSEFAPGRGTLRWLITPELLGV